MRKFKRESKLTILLFVQLVYKVKLEFVLEQLASASVGGYGQNVLSELVEEAKINLMKITVSVTVLPFKRQQRLREAMIFGFVEYFV